MLSANATCCTTLLMNDPYLIRLILRGQKVLRFFRSFKAFKMETITWCSVGNSVPLVTQTSKTEKNKSRKVSVPGISALLLNPFCAEKCLVHAHSLIGGAELQHTPSVLVNVRSSCSCCPITPYQIALSMVTRALKLPERNTAGFSNKLLLFSCQRRHVPAPDA